MTRFPFSDIFTLLSALFQKAGGSDVPVTERIFITGFLWILFTPFVFSQDKEHADGGHFVKRIEYNLITRGGKANNITFIDHYNLLGKGDMEKLFFGDFNAPVEFVFDPSSEYDPCIPSGFRMVKDSLSKSFILEVKYISNYDEASKEADKEARDPRHMIDLPAEVLDALPRSVFNLIWDHNSNKNIVKRYFEELPGHFQVESLSFPISDRFAEKLYGKMVSFIDHFKAKGAPPTILDGYSVIFRTVVDDEVWSLSIHEPQGNALQMADLCRQIITDAKANTFEESKYVVDMEETGREGTRDSATLYGQSSSDQYGYFTSERRSILVQIGSFFDRTVRENFPAGTDSLSYRRFFECIRQNMSTNKAPFILHVDRHELQAINQRLFRDENYYFFYKEQVIVPENEFSKRHQDSVPVKRTSAPASTGILLLAPILNKDGYIREVTEWNRVVLSAQYLMRAFGDIGMTVFVEGEPVLK